MENLNFSFPCGVVHVEELIIPKAVECVRLINSLNFYSLVECQRSPSGDEIVIFDVDVEKSQVTVNDIRYTERIVVDFHKEDVRAPWVYALRQDFPQIPHLNLRAFDVPKCLCIYELPYDELRLQWRGGDFLERIREWLKFSALGELHQEDQPLEPLMLGANGIIFFPQNVFNIDEFSLRKIDEEHGGVVLQAKQLLQTSAKAGGAPYLMIALRGEVQEHGIISKTPQNLKDLQEILSKANIDLFQELKNRIGIKHLEEKYLKHKLIILLELPKSRRQNKEHAGYDNHAVLTDDSLWHLGKKLGLTKKKSRLDIVKDPDLAVCGIKLLIPHIEFNPVGAALYNGADDAPTETVSLIGAGALGSQVYNNLVRSGYSSWNIIDDDRLLPHNLARHSLGATEVGLSKAKTLASFGNSLLNNNSSKAFVENILRPVDSTAVLESLQKSDLILDISASVPAARSLAYLPNVKGKRVSIFLNPEGSDLIVLAENQARTLTLDAIEMQYYRYLLSASSLSNHLNSATAGVRYANSCRSVSSRIPQDYLSIHSGIAARIVKKLIASSEAYAGIWSIEPDTLEVVKYEVPTHDVQAVNLSGWDVIIDKYLLDAIQAARTTKLPNETGGILIGSYDMIRKKIYLVDTILSPKDSEEYPYAYIRGIEGVKEKLEHIQNVTASNLEYVGEWHSHPERCSLRPSADDRALFSWLKGYMDKLSRPPLMLIAGDNDQFKLLVESIPE